MVIGDNQVFLRMLNLQRDSVPSFEEYPFNIPALVGLDELRFDSGVTFFVGENGCGKSTLIEAIAVAAGFNPEGGSKNFRFVTRRSESVLHKYIRLSRGTKRERDGFFLRAESYFNLGTNIEHLDEGGGGAPIIDSYGGTSLHEQSHGESFLALALHRFGDCGMYILDEPEAALSPRGQLALLSRMHHLVERQGSQFIVATHSPILMSYPGASVYLLCSEGVRKVAYNETEHYKITLEFLRSPQSFLRHLMTLDEAD